MPSRSGGLTNLDEQFRIESISDLASTVDFADVRIAWNNNGLALFVSVTGKTKPLNCRPESLLESDGFQVWVNTRNSQTTHRATKYCQRFLFLPRGEGRTGKSPIVKSIPMARSLDTASGVDVTDIQIQSEVFQTGYQMDIWIPSEALTGFDPSEHPQAGFYYVVRDSELGSQYLTVGDEFPYASDPSLWQTIEFCSVTRT
ncbi:MAG: hypothetical protein FJ267_20150 [Planctomycetes bacterium]|nr:hypothetical protein [Planctomycetota bacterium]